jgi:hypothetical protein
MTAGSELDFVDSHRQTTFIYSVALTFSVVPALGVFGLTAHCIILLLKEILKCNNVDTALSKCISFNFCPVGQM